MIRTGKTQKTSTKKIMKAQTEDHRVTRMNGTGGNGGAEN